LPDTSDPTPVPAGLLRRLISAVYDLLLVIGVLMIATLGMVVATGGEAIPSGTVAYQLSVLLILFLFFGGFWVYGGQTLGMRAWRLRVETQNGQPLDWTQAVGRFAAAFLAWLPLGIGIVWLIFDPQKLAWHDRLSGTRVVLLPKTPKTRA
jgi:uncharacterized RDD family membrane protein YckC